MNEKLIQQVLQIEKQAQEIRAVAMREAEQLPILADQEARLLIEKTKADAQKEARQMFAKAQAEEETARILDQAEEKNHQVEALAMSNFDRAVAYVVERVIGRV